MLHWQYRSRFGHCRGDCPWARQPPDTPMTTYRWPLSEEGSAAPLETYGGTKTREGSIPFRLVADIPASDANVQAYLSERVWRVCPFSTLEIFSAKPKSISLILKGSFWWFTNITFSSLMSACTKLSAFIKSRALASYVDICESDVLRQRPPAGEWVGSPSEEHAASFAPPWSPPDFCPAVRTRASCAHSQRNLRRSWRCCGRTQVYAKYKPGDRWNWYQRAVADDNIIKTFCLPLMRPVPLKSLCFSSF